MANYTIAAMYILALFAVFIVPLYLNINRSNIIKLSFLPPFLVAVFASVIMIITGLFDQHIQMGDILTVTIFVFFEVLLGGYILMFPILITVSFIVEYLRCYKHYDALTLSGIGAVTGAVMVGIGFQTWKFVWLALVSGFFSVWIHVKYRKDTQDFSI
jgi:hypothetical protein